MTVFVYDGSFEGLLSCIFESYHTKVEPINIVDVQHHQLVLLEDTKEINANEIFAERVIKGVNARTDGKGASIIYKMFLSELPQVEMTIYHFIKVIVNKNTISILENFADPYVLKASQIEKMIHREVHRMHAFVRFQKTRKGIFYAVIDPDFNVIPLIGEHFEKRYADQLWIIFDTKRHYGLFYNLHETVFITADDPMFSDILDLKETMDDKENFYQALWGNYFQSVNIQERNNRRLQLRHMPRRYWKYLIETKKG